MLYRTTKKADVVLAIIAEQTQNDRKNTIYVLPYHNGRERGWELKNGDKSVVFSEYRNTDQIVIYCGLSREFDNAIPSNQIYANKTFFGYNEYTKAAEFCLNYLFS